MFTIRRVSADDGMDLKSIRLAALADAPYAFSSTYATEALRSDEDWGERARSGAAGTLRATFLAEDASRLVGLVGGYRHDDADRRVELVSMWVAPSHRRGGVGRALVRTVLEWAAETEAETVSLWVTRGNRAAESLYRSLGFEDTGDHQPLPSDPCRDEVRLERHLLA